MSRQDEACAFADLRAVTPILGSTPILQTNEISSQYSSVQYSNPVPVHATRSLSFEGLNAALRCWHVA